jgi:putative FmdB family regulatory protein
MPTYEFLRKECGHEWEVEMSIKAPDPEECPQCHAKGDIIRLISGGSGKGKVVLTGNELTAKIKEDAQKIKQEAAQDANTYASLIGEERYHAIQTQMDRRRR